MKAKFVKNKKSEKGNNGSLKYLNKRKTCQIKVFLLLYK